MSIIIANCNYRDFVGAAIESALAIDWPDMEMIDQQTRIWALPRYTGLRLMGE